MLKINCDICENELKEPGALLFTPPEVRPSQWSFPKCTKLHICVECFDKTITSLDKLQKQNRRKHVKRKRKYSTKKV